MKLSIISGALLCTLFLSLIPRLDAPRSKGLSFHLSTGRGKERKSIKLGDNYHEALIKYSEITMPSTKGVVYLKDVVTRYLAEISTQKSLNTFNDNQQQSIKILEFFDGAPIDEVMPKNIRQFMDWRGKAAKFRANREFSLLAVVFNKAREWGYTDKQNPCVGITKFKEEGRDKYVSDEEYKLLWDAACAPLRNALDLAYLTGQRPSDVLAMKAEDIIDGYLLVKQNKTKAKLRISVTGELVALIAKLPTSGNLLINESGLPLTSFALRSRFDKARKISGVDFRFMDLRAKAATDKEEIHGLGAAQDQLRHTDSKMTQHYVRNKQGKKVTPTR